MLVAPRHMARSALRRKPMRGVRRISRVAILHLVEALALVFAGVAIVCAFGLWRLSQGPLGLNFMRDEFEEALADALGGDAVSLGAVEAVWEGEDRSIAIVLRDVAVAERGGDLVTSAPRLEAGLRVSALVRGRVAFSSLFAEGGDMTVARDAEGAIAVGLGAPDHVLKHAAAAPPRAGRGGLDALRAALDRGAAAGSLREFRIENATLYVRDDVTGVSWRADDATLRVTRDETDGVRAEAAGDIATARGPARLRLSARAGPSMSQALFEAELRDAVPAVLFPSDGPLHMLAGVDAPVGVTASAVVDDRMGLLGADLAFTIGPGAATLLGETEEVRSGSGRVSYDPASGAVSLDGVSLDAGVLRGRFRGRLDAAADWLWGSGAGPYAINLAVDDFALDLRPVFDAPLDASHIEIRGAVAPDVARVTFETLNVDTRALHAEFTGEARLETASDGRTLPALQLDGPISGIGTLRDVLDFWPVELGDGAREWVEESVHGGRVTSARFTIDMPAEALVAQQIDDERLRLDFAFEDASASFVSTMSPLTNARGAGVLYGNHFALTLEEGELAGLTLQSGFVDIPRLKPKGAVARFGGVARGGLDDVLAFIDEPPLQFPSSYGVDPRAIGGTGEVTFEITRPMLVDVPPEDIGFAVEGAFSDVSSPTMIAGLEVNGAAMTLTAAPEGITAIADGFLGPAPAHLEWREDLSGARAHSTSYRVEADIDSATFDKLGVPARRVLSGVAHLVVDSEGTGFDVARADVALDLADAALALPDSTWAKPAGEAAEARFSMRRDEAGAYRFEDAAFSADGADVAGDFSLADDGRLLAVDLDRVRFDRIVDASGALTRGADGGLEINAHGALVDARGLVAQAMQGGDPIGAPLRVEAAFERAVIGDGVAVSDVAFTLNHDGVRVRRMMLDSHGEAGPLVASIEPDGAGARTFHLEAADAGDAIAAFLGLDSVRGGTLSVDAAMPALDAPEDAPTEARILMRDFRLAGAPPLAQVLTLASLQGLGNTLAGEGIRFDRLDAPVTLDGGVVRIDEARASGQALGVTVNGAIDVENQTFDLDGVLVPAYGVNSALGAVPVIGDIFVSRRGEGIFALTYSLDGPFAETRVFVNPLSALAPGFLRRLFEPVETARSDHAEPSSEGATGEN